MELPRPEFAGRRLLLVVSGSVSAMHLPFWLNWLDRGYPDLSVRCVVTASAERFVSRESIGLLTRTPALRDRWPEESSSQGALHVELDEWHDSALVFPACLNYVSRLASGLGDSPSLLALQCSASPVVVAPALPQGASDNPIIARNLEALATRPNVRVAPVGRSRSVTTREEGEGLAPMWSALSTLEELRVEMGGGAVTAHERTAGDGPAETTSPPEG